MITKSLVWADVETLGDRDVGGEAAVWLGFLVPLLVIVEPFFLCIVIL